jgi:type III pantothenate kinase
MKMLLFDAGNSRCKWAWIDNGLWLQQGVIENKDEAAWQQLNKKLLKLDAPGVILASNVAGAIIAQKLHDLCAGWGCPVQFITAQTSQCGVRNLYEESSQLGSDRWAALIAAWHHVQGACLVVNCGTATTVDALSATGEFLGGVISPGIKLMQSSLQSNTAQLECKSGTLSNFPRNTADAITSGVLRATIGVIQHQYALLAAQGHTQCLVGGGAADLLLGYLDLKCEQKNSLVLQGLQIIAQDIVVIQEKETAT